ncbi:lectin-like protein [Candidatus Uabimicrobium sp. HlEnr_7]
MVAPPNKKPTEEENINPPKVDPPKVDPPKVDPPKVDPPKVDPPKVDPPKVVTKWTKKLKFKTQKRSLSNKEIYKILSKQGIKHGKIKHFGKHDYLVIKKAHTYTKAQELCKDLGGYPLTITSQKESDFIASFKLEGLHWMGLFNSKKNPNKFRLCTKERLSHSSKYLDHSIFDKISREVIIATHIAGDNKLSWWPLSNKAAAFVICEWGKKRRSKVTSKERNIIAQVYYNRPQDSFGITTKYFNANMGGWWLYNPNIPIEFESTLTSISQGKVFIGLNTFAAFINHQSFTYYDIYVNDVQIVENYQVTIANPSFLYYDISQAIKKGLNRIQIRLNPYTSRGGGVIKGISLYSTR